jgi:mono/diheme cytochrome c family protein
MKNEKQETANGKPETGSDRLSFSVSCFRSPVFSFFPARFRPVRVRRSEMPLRLSGSWCLWAILLLGACRQDMHDQPRYDPFERSAFFDDRRAARPLVPGTVVRGHLDEDDALFRGLAGTAPVEAVPLPISPQLLARGRERYDIYCSPCHDRVGTGGGMIVQRGFKRPASLHDARLRESPAGYFFHVISNGFGVMSGYAAQILVADRWAIVAYIRALQLSQHATLADLADEERARLEQQRDGN